MCDDLEFLSETYFVIIMSMYSMIYLHRTCLRATSYAALFLIPKLKTVT